ncbi:MAG: NAD-dependent epimerase/dehydratase family protein [Chloroflexi bacterium]|nr:NAD-dependent epimerase/dehydratase family protein [Chloroflexota bacterium]
MTVIITGRTGFIGSHIARHLVKRRGAAKVVLFDANPNHPRVADIEKNVVIVHGDLQEPMDLLQTMRAHDVERVAHLAYAIGSLANANPPRFVSIDAVGTTNVFEAARIHGVKRVVYASSLGVYPTSNAVESKAALEDEFPKPNTIYGACKVLNEVTAEVYRTQFGLDTIGIRLPRVFGHERLSRNLGSASMWGDVPGMVALGRPAELPPLNQLVDWVHVEDAA